MANRSEIVVLLHGIARTRHSMAPVARALRKAGYETLALSYPSRRANIDGLARFIHDALERAGVWQNHERVHFVTHSMGGLVAARYLQNHADLLPPTKIGRMVMLAPPNGGSEVAQFLTRLPPYRWLYGPAGQELTVTARAAVETRLHCEVGIIAGTTGWPYLLGSLLICDAHDGRVAVSRTRLAGMTDHLILPATHSFILWQPEVHRQVIAFLRNSAFKRRS